MFPAGRMVEIWFSSQCGGENGPGENGVHVDLILRLFLQNGRTGSCSVFSVFHSKLVTNKFFQAGAYRHVFPVKYGTKL